MDLKIRLNSSVPEELRYTKAFRVMLNLISQKGINDVKSLKKVLDDEIKKSQVELKKYSVGRSFSQESTTLNRKRVELGKWIDTLKEGKQILDKYV